MSKEAKIDDRVVAININRTYRDGINSDDLYDNTRGVWRLSKVRAEKADYVFAVYKGIVKEIYQPDNWVPAGTTKYLRRQFDPIEFVNRHEFEGKLAPEAIREKYLGKMIPAGGRYPIRYFNC